MSEMQEDNKLKEIRKSMREGLGISPSGFVGLVLYESQCEQAWRQFCLDISRRYEVVLMFPLGERALKHFMATNPNLPNVRLIDSLEIEPACDEVIVFRFVEDLLVGRKIPARILDVNNRWLSQELSDAYA